MSAVLHDRRAAAGRVLVADDSAVARALVGRELSRCGYEVLTAADGAEALAQARAELPDVILLDVEMPVLDGFGALGELRADPRTSDIPVVFLTGIEEAESAARGLEAGAHDYLRKPFQPVELQARVGAAQRTKRLQDELRRSNEELTTIASTDGLTGLINRRFATEHLERMASRSRRHGSELSVVLLDIDHFKSINDGHGHAGGDAVLREVARRMARRMRAEDVLARWGGEEFLVLLPDIGADGAAIVAEALRALVAGTPFALEDDTVAVTISLGWATWAGEDADGLVRTADDALYRAKESGRNRAVGRDPAPR